MSSIRQKVSRDKGGGVQIAGAEDEEDSEKRERKKEKKRGGGETRHPETKAGQKPPSRLRSLVSFRDGFLG